MTSTTLRRASALALAFFLGACTTPYHPPQFLEPNPAFPGLVDLPANNGGKPVDVLLVHGICTHTAAWADDVVHTLATAIQVNLPAPELDVRPRTPAGIEVVTSRLAAPGGTLRFDGLIWSPLTQELKKQLCYDQTSKSSLCTGSQPFTPTRARINARLKDYLIDDCVPDALIYQGVSRDTMQQRMRDAVLQILDKGDNAPATPLVIVAESMGSKYLFDTLLRMAQEPADSRAASVARQAIDRMQYLVMAGNQIPMLALADQQIDSTAAVTTAARPATVQPDTDSLQQLLQMRRQRSASIASNAKTAPRTNVATPLVLVAFTDPSDVLSYTLQTERYAREGATVYNVLVSNAPIWFGVLERPDTAHLNYLENADVARLIACGQPVSKRCMAR
jgi:hypothetical protein